MIKWLKKNQKETPSIQEVQEENTQQEISKTGLYSRFKHSLQKTRQHFGESVGRLLLGKKNLDESLLAELETILLNADLGPATTQEILKDIIEKLERKQLSEGQAVLQVLKDHLENLLMQNTKILEIPSETTPFVILTVGINGAGKTTTIGKLAKQFQSQGKKVLLAAGDTFRAAAIQQLQVWGERNQIPVIAQQTGADSASVIFDALQAAKARNIDIVIADTAGRLHTQNNLMEELKKVKRVMQKLNPEFPHETLLILDASIGQNALNQAREFHQSVGVTGIAMTKLDGTAKGGILFAIAKELAIPFRYIGIGEGIDDLQPLNSQQFVNALFNND